MRVIVRVIVRVVALVCGLVVIAPGVVCAGEAADEAGMVTDRPDVAESSRTVAPWRVQLETGVDVEHTFGLTRTFALSAPTKLRVGVAKMAELHLESDVVQVLRTAPSGQDATTEASGMALDVGGKVHLLDERGAVPSLGVLAAVTLPTGGALAQGGVGATVKVAADWSLTELVGLGVNVGLTTPITERVWATSLVWASSFGFGVTDDLGLYMELFGESPLEDRGGAQWTLSMDGGCTLKLSPNLQLDAYVRAGQINRRATLGGGMGVSVRI